METGEPNNTRSSSVLVSTRRSSSSNNVLVSAGDGPWSLGDYCWTKGEERSTLW
jgi:hypothetical protein